MPTVTVCKNLERAYGAKAALAALPSSNGPEKIKGRDVLLKPNFNTADPAPGSTDNQTLMTLIHELWDWGAKSITLGERSWRDTRMVLELKGVGPLLEKAGVKVLIFDDLPEKDWVKVRAPGSHWPHGMRVARPILEAECVVATCCLKTHQYGGVFTMSLKLAVGIAPGGQQMPAYMNALHSSPHQRRMIAELNTAYEPAFVLMDGVDAFVDGGPDVGQSVPAGLMLASDNRVALDAAGLACLKELGSNPAIMNTPIFEQEQIMRAVELGLGPDSAKAIAMVPADKDSADYTERLAGILREG